MRRLFRQRLFFRNCRPFTAAVLVVTLSPAADAELRVIQSNAPQYKVGDVFPDGTKFELCPGCYVRALRLPSNETVLFEGSKLPKPPYGGTRGKPRESDR